ncbi:MAG TPA: aromatic hydrocarbon degradation protein, partial [Alcanivorax sp.]|nr:aromatic hydrocarbon degradation protein [Alcanivorax sp.]HBT07637.1 aromatic hydrocarbon degradation protein [Alcanivorax sp.]
MNNKIVARGAALALAIGSTTAAYASMGNIGTTYGVLPSDVASAQALSMFNTQV